MLFPFHDHNPTQRLPIVTVGLIAVNVVVFLATWRLTPDEQMDLALEHGFIPARVEQWANGEPLEISVPADPGDQELIARDRIVLLPAERGQIASTVFSCMFMHGGWMHLLGNMWFLWLFGNNVEDRLGHLLYLLFYVAGGLFATFCHWLPDPHSGVPVIGASGAVSAILGAYAITWPHARIKTFVMLFVFITVIDLPALLVLGIWFATQIIEAIGAMQFPMGGGVAWWAHIGGFAAGVAAMLPLNKMFFSPTERQPAPSLWDQQD
ncbi:MAG: rhomboid family intramembrane serine protease [Pirellulales bacterium]